MIYFNWKETNLPWKNITILGQYLRLGIYITRYTYYIEQWIYFNFVIPLLEFVFSYMNRHYNIIMIRLLRDIRTNDNRGTCRGYAITLLTTDVVDCACDNDINDVEHLCDGPSINGRRCETRGAHIIILLPPPLSLDLRYNFSAIIIVTGN